MTAPNRTRSVRGILPAPSRENAARDSALPPLVIPYVDGLDSREAAHLYLHEGFTPHPWKPARRNGKWEKISCRSGFSFNEIEETHDSIDRWHPSWRCGLVTSFRAGIFVADVDDRPKFEAWDPGFDFPFTEWQFTGRAGGVHLLFDGRGLSEDEWPRQGQIKEAGLDIKSNGFVAVAPSLHPLGRAYRWAWDEEWDLPYAIAPGLELGRAIRRYQDERRGPGGGDKYRYDKETASALWQAVLDGGQHDAIKDWQWNALGRGWSPEETVDYLEFHAMRGNIRTLNKRSPWKRSDFKTMLPKRGPKPNAAVDELDGIAETDGILAREIPPNLPDEFWEAYPALQVIRQAAHSRVISADAVLSVVFARLSAMVPPGLRPDSGTGRFSLTLFAALCGGPGTGKTKSMTAAMDLLPELIKYSGMNGDAADIFNDDVPLGSGQGIAEAFYGMREVLGGNGRPKNARMRVYDHVFLTEDEGQSLAEALALTGSEVGKTIRRAGSGITIGQGNARAETTRKVERGTYSIGIAVGFQPASIAPLLAEVNVGTPQRFIFLSSTDPSIPDEPVSWPDELALDIDWPENITFPESVQAEARTGQLANGRGENGTETFDEHKNLTRLRLAAFLAVLDGRSEVTEDKDWKWSSVVWDTSCAVRDFMDQYRVQQATRAEIEIRERQAGRAVAVEDARERRTALLDQAIGRTARHIQRDRCDGGCKRKCITNSLSSGLRKQVDIDILLSRLVTEGYAKRANADGVYAPGAKRAT